MRTKYQVPEIEIFLLRKEDAIATSGLTIIEEENENDSNVKWSDLW